MKKVSGGNFAMKSGAALMSAAFALAPAANVFAASEDLIDMNRSGSITLTKYDMTAAKEDGIDVAAQQEVGQKYHPNGKQNVTAEKELSRYVIEGVQFTYGKVADINTVSEAGSIQIMFDIPHDLAEILGLSGGKSKASYVEEGSYVSGSTSDAKTLEITERSGDDAMYTSDQINKALSDLLSDNSRGKNILEDYIETLFPNNTQYTNSEGKIKVSIPKGQLGLYLFVETEVPANVHTTTDPFFVTVPMTDEEGDSWFYDLFVYPKNQADIPDLDKLVRQSDDADLYDKPEYDDIATGSEGDVMDYIFVSHLPSITSEATFLQQYTFLDKMDKGLTYNKDVAIYFYDNEEDARANNTGKAKQYWNTGSPNFTVDYPATADYQQMKVTMTKQGLQAINTANDEDPDTNYGKMWMVVSYSATINSDESPILGDEGNTNDVQLTWNRTSQDFIDTLEDRARVYTFGINLTKKFGESDREFDFSDVHFVLQNASDGHYVTAKGGEDGVYYVTDATKSEDEENGTVFIPSDSGKLVIKGLEADDYILTELHTSDGYSLLKEPINISFDCTVDEFVPSKTTLYDSQDDTNNPNKKLIETEGKRASVTVDGNATAMSDCVIKNVTSHNAFVDMTVTNTPSFKLPMTGGTGTIICTVGGSVLVLAAVALLTTRKKHNA